MERNCNLDEISDGKLYDLNDMVKADCNDCKGCSACCQGMGSSIILDPLDIYRLSINLNHSFEELLVDRIELNVVDGIILPNIKMVGETERCAFLDLNGRCSIHSFRPGVCRIFPLGRLYENNDFKFILQTHECKKVNRTKIKVSKWIDTPNIKENKQFVVSWHYFLKYIQKIVKNTQDDNLVRSINMYVLNNFFVRPYHLSADFYLQFNERLDRAKEYIKEICLQE